MLIARAALSAACALLCAASSLAAEVPRLPAPDAGLLHLSRAQIESKAAHGFTPDGRFAVTFDAHSDPAYPKVVALQRLWRREGETASYERTAIYGTKGLPDVVEFLSYHPDGGLVYQAAASVPGGKWMSSGGFSAKELRGPGRLQRVLSSVTDAVRRLGKS